MLSLIHIYVISRLDFEDASQKVCDQLSEDGLRITLIATDGTVLYDSMEDETKMENHRGRPEVERALAVGEGRGMRKSTTSAEHTFYYAMRLSDGNVLRIGKESGSIYHLAWNMTMLTLGVGSVSYTHLNELIQMGSMIEHAIEMGISALVRQDVEKAKKAIAYDEEIDEQEKTCLLYTSF